MNTTAENSQREEVLKTKRTTLETLIPKINQLLLTDSIDVPLLKHIFNEVLRSGDRNIYEGWLRFRGNEAKFSIFPELKEQLKNISDSDGDFKLSRKIAKINIFKVKQLYTQDNFYIFEDTNGNIFHAIIGDFDANGVNAESLNFGTPPINTESNLVKGFTINTSGHSLNLQKGQKIITTIVGDLITVIDKDTGDIIVVNENLLEYIRIEDNGKQIPQGNPISHPYGTIKKGSCPVTG